MPDNSVTLIGNTTREVELRFTSGGNAVAAFGLAINTRKRNASGEWEDGDTGFYDVTIFGDQAENLVESLPKGTRVIVTGRLNYSTWESKGGDKRSKVEVVADEVGPSLKWATAQVTKT